MTAAPAKIALVVGVDDQIMASRHDPGVVFFGPRELAERQPIPPRCKLAVFFKCEACSIPDHDRQRLEDEAKGRKIVCKETGGLPMLNEWLKHFWTDERYKRQSAPDDRSSFLLYRKIGPGGQRKWVGRSWKKLKAAPQAHSVRQTTRLAELVNPTHPISVQIDRIISAFAERSETPPTEREIRDAIRLARNHRPVTRAVSSAPNPLPTSALQQDKPRQPKSQTRITPQRKQSELSRRFGQLRRAWGEFLNDVRRQNHGGRCNPELLEDFLVISNLVGGVLDIEDPSADGSVTNAVRRGRRIEQELKRRQRIADKRLHKGQEHDLNSVSKQINRLLGSPVVDPNRL